MVIKGITYVFIVVLLCKIESIGDDDTIGVVLCVYSAMLERFPLVDLNWVAKLRVVYYLLVVVVG